MATFINVDGKIINLDNPKIEIIWYAGSRDLVWTEHVAQFEIQKIRGDSAESVYEWLKYECVATFPYRTPFREGDAIYLPAYHRNVIVTKVEDLGLDGQHYHYVFVDSNGQVNTGYTSTPQPAKKFGE